MKTNNLIICIVVLLLLSNCKKQDAPTPSSGLSASPDNNAPTAPVITNPLNNSTDIGSSVTITWSHSTDPENDNITYSVYLGVTQNNLPIISNGQEQNSFTVTDLEPLTLYYVKVEALDDHSNQTPGDTHQFTTSATVPGNSGPTVPVITAPINNSLDVNSPLIIVWNASTDPDNDNITYNVLLGETPSNLSVISAGQAQTSYTVNELDLLTEYYVQIEALDDHNHTTPSAQHQFTTSKFGSFTDDRDGKVYGTVKIGNQIWMAENLRYELANESWDYNSNPANSATYGKLYSWSGVNNAVPPGWHLPTDDEWKTLEAELGMPLADLNINNYSTDRGTDQGTQLQAGGSSGMDFLPAGFRYNGSYDALGNRTYLWVNTTIAGNPFRRRLNVNEPYVYRFTNPEGGYAISIRVIKDN